MESPLIVSVSLLFEFMGTKCNVYIHRTEQNGTNLYWTNISTIYNNKSIQHNSTDRLDPPFRLNCHHGDSSKMSWLDIIWQSVKNKRIVKQKTSPHWWHHKFNWTQLKDVYCNTIIVIHRITQRLKPTWVYLPHGILALITLKWPHCGETMVSMGASTGPKQPLQQDHGRLKFHQRSSCWKPPAQLATARPTPQRLLRSSE